MNPTRNTQPMITWRPSMTTSVRTCWKSSWTTRTSWFTKNSPSISCYSLVDFKTKSAPCSISFTITISTTASAFGLTRARTYMEMIPEYESRVKWAGEMVYSSSFTQAMLGYRRSMLPFEVSGYLSLTNRTSTRLVRILVWTWRLAWQQTLVSEERLHITCPLPIAVVCRVTLLRSTGKKMTCFSSCMIILFRGSTTILEDSCLFGNGTGPCRTLSRSASRCAFKSISSTNVASFFLLCYTQLRWN